MKPYTEHMMFKLQFCAGAAAGSLSIEPAKYPDVKRDEDFAEELHGVSIPDAYRWLEDSDSAETKSCA